MSVKRFWKGGMGRWGGRMCSLVRFSFGFGSFAIWTWEGGRLIWVIGDEIREGGDLHGEMERGLGMNW